MSNGKLELSYHPALDQMKFRRYENGGWACINPDASVLHKYTGDKKEIILQNLGNEFFNDIAKSMDGIKEIVIDFRGTKLDYGDFLSMVDHYKRQNTDVSFSIGAFAELKDMESLYQDIKLFSDEIIETLENASRNDALGESLKKEIEGHNKDLSDKKGELDKNEVNLCFVGTYSSGKSTLINAILGYEILPEALESKTAKMFRITPIENYRDSGISFVIGTGNTGRCVELRWDETDKIFRFHTEVQENVIRKTIQECINENKDEPLHTQLRRILTKLNNLPNYPVFGNSAEYGDYVNGIIYVSFPVPLCGDVRFTIYDTPGTDSNYTEHLSILKHALEKQTNSILVFVNRPTKLEGTGNGMLIQLLNDIEKNATKSTIDVGRSLFVINAADEIMKGDEGFNDVKNGVIKLQSRSQEESVSEKEENKVKEIPLNDKRLFFISARAAYVARANKNKIAIEDDEEDKRGFLYKLVESKKAGYYRYNNLSLSEYATEQMLEEASQAAEKAKDNIDDLFVVNSGLYSLENEIKKYGSKFAMAVKAKSIIEAVQFVIDNFDNKVKALERHKELEKEELETKITTLREVLTSQINTKFDEFITGEKVNVQDEIPVAIITKLRLGDEPRLKLIKKIKDETEKIWDIGFTGEWAKRGSKEALDKINRYFRQYYENYDHQSKSVIEDRISSFNESIINIIKDFNIDDETKRMLLLVPKVNVGEAPKISDKIETENYLKKIFFGLFIKLNKDEFRDAIEKEAMIQFDKARLIFKDDYKERLDNKLKEVSDNYLSNIDRYSGDLERLRDDKTAVERELEQIKKLLSEMQDKNDILIKKIWSDKNG
ncbi:hypothetical protein FACS189483_08980 [Spirochaetia bacterium]|nr:hypothetical protein FACS189483_08980 [Spirochaetia bacterium]